MSALLEPEYKEFSLDLELKILVAAKLFTDAYPPLSTPEGIEMMGQSLNELVAKMRADAID